MPLLCPSSIDSDMHKSIIHGAGEEIHFLSIMSKHFKGCILVFEHCYFLLQTNSNAKNALDIAVKEYQQSETQAIVFNALQDAIKKHGDDHCDSTLIKVITDIILTNQMCKLSKLLVWASEHLMIHISKKIFVNNNLRTPVCWFMMCLPPYAIP